MSNTCCLKASYNVTDFLFEVFDRMKLMLYC